MHEYPCLLKFSLMNEIMSGLFLTVLLTDGPEGAEENVTHQQYGFHDASSNLNWSMPLKAPDTVGYQKDENNRFLRTAGSKEKKLFLCGGPHQKRKKKKNTLPSQNCWRLKVKYESCSSRDMNAFLPKPSKSFTLGESRSLSYGDPFVTHHLLRQIGLYTWE